MTILSQAIIGAVGVPNNNSNRIIGPPFWGVDSVAPADKPFCSAPSQYEWITRHSNGRPPAFFGRYLTDIQGQQIDCKEKEFLGKRSCKILLCYKRMSPEDVSKLGSAGYKDGSDHANEAANRAHALGVPSHNPPSVWIYANIDSGYVPSYVWMAGWWEGLKRRGYGPGIYFNEEPNSVLVHKSLQKCHEVDLNEISVWTNHGATTSCTVGGQFTPQNTSGVVQVWQYAFHCFSCKIRIKNGHHMEIYVDMDLANKLGYERMWDVTTTTCP